MPARVDKMNRTNKWTNNELINKKINESINVRACGQNE